MRTPGRRAGDRRRVERPPRGEGGAGSLPAPPNRDSAVYPPAGPCEECASLDYIADLEISDSPPPLPPFVPESMPRCLRLLGEVAREYRLRVTASSWGNQVRALNRATAVLQGFSLILMIPTVLSKAPSQPFRTAPAFVVGARPLVAHRAVPKELHPFQMTMGTTHCGTSFAGLLTNLLTGASFISASS